MGNIPPDSQPTNCMRIGRLSALPSWSVINWRNRLDSVASHATRHAENQAIATADVRWGKPYVCRFVDRSNQDKQGKSPTMTLNTGTKTKRESCYSARVVMCIRSHRYKCAKIVTKPLFRKQHRARQSVIPCRKLERTTCLATWAAHAAVKFGHEEQSTNKNKQTVPNEESENVEGLPSNLLFIWPFVKILCMSSKSSISGSIFWVHLLTKQFELHSFRLNITIRCPITGCRANRRFRPLLWDNCKVCTPRTALATLAQNDFRKWFQNWILWFWNSCAEQALEWTDPKDPRTIVAQN